MQPKYLASLEFDKILSRAAQGIVCPEARGLLLEEQPGATPQAVRDKPVSYTHLTLPTT